MIRLYKEDDTSIVFTANGAESFAVEDLFKYLFNEGTFEMVHVHASQLKTKMIKETGHQAFKITLLDDTVKDSAFFMLKMHTSNPKIKEYIDVNW